MLYVTARKQKAQTMQEDAKYMRYRVDDVLRDKQNTKYEHQKNPPGALFH